MITSRQLDDWSARWIMDRVQSGDPLWWEAFIDFAEQNGAPDWVLRRYQRQSYRKAARRYYLAYKQELVHFYH